MPKPRPLYTAHAQGEPGPDALHEDAPRPAQEPTAQAEPVYKAILRRKAEAAPAQPAAAPDGYHITKGWIDTADRTRTWNLLDPEGNKVAEICTKRDAAKLADILNGIKPDERGRSR